MGFDLAKVIGSIAPTLATMLGGPLAGTAVSALEGAFGLNAGAGTGAIADVMQSGGMTPEIIANVRAADQKHTEIIGQQGIDLAKINLAHEEALESIAVDDVKSARLRQVSLKDITLPILAYLIVGSFLGMVGAVLFEGSTADSVMAGTLIGYLSAKAEQVVSYYFGSSAAHQRTTELLAQSPAIEEKK